MKNNLSNEFAMSERMVDVLSGNNTVLHTYPITVGVSDVPAKDAEYEMKASKAAAHAQLVPDADLKRLTTRMHVSRSGALAPYGDDRDTLSETEQALEQAVRERAYFLWQRDGSPHGREAEYWHIAHDQHIRERAYVLWQQEGCQEGRADEYWHRTCEFETH
jgi:Protein of unknown function (DUF2934)